MEHNIRQGEIILNWIRLQMLQLKKATDMVTVMIVMMIMMITTRRTRTMMMMIENI